MDANKMPEKVRIIVGDAAVTRFFPEGGTMVEAYVGGNIGWVIDDGSDGWSDNAATALGISAMLSNEGMAPGALLAERDSLRAINRDLVAALDMAMEAIGKMPCGTDGWPSGAGESSNRLMRALVNGRAALAKAEGGVK